MYNFSSKAILQKITETFNMDLANNILKVFTLHSSKGFKTFFKGFNIKSIKQNYKHPLVWYLLDRMVEACS